MNAMNLRLPLCPKCGDTKPVKKCETQLLLVSTTQFCCENCNIKWWAHPSHCDGTIVDEHGEFHHV
jgi:hypothetical protein